MEPEQLVPEHPVERRREWPAILGLELLPCVLLAVMVWLEIRPVAFAPREQFVWSAAEVSQRRLAALFVAYKLNALESVRDAYWPPTLQDALEPYFVSDELRARLRLEGDASAAVRELLRLYEIREDVFCRSGAVADNTIIATERTPSAADNSRLALAASGVIMAESSGAGVIPGQRVVIAPPRKMFR